MLKFRKKILWVSESRSEPPWKCEKSEKVDFFNTFWLFFFLKFFSVFSLYLQTLFSLYYMVLSNFPSLISRFTEKWPPPCWKIEKVDFFTRFFFFEIFFLFKSKFTNFFSVILYGFEQLFFIDKPFYWKSGWGGGGYEILQFFNRPYLEI